MDLESEINFNNIVTVDGIVCHLSYKSAQICQIFAQTNYYVLFIFVLLMLIWNCLKVTAHCFIAVIYELHGKNQHSTRYI